MDRMKIKMPTPSTADRTYELIFSTCKRMFPGSRGEGWNVLVGRVRNATQGNMWMVTMIFCV